MTEQTDTNMYCMQIKDILSRYILNINETILSTLHTIIYQEIKEKVIENIQKNIQKNKPKITNLNLFSTNTKTPTINVPDKTGIDTLKNSENHKLYETLVTEIEKSNLAKTMSWKKINYENLSETLTNELSSNTKLPSLLSDTNKEKTTAITAFQTIKTKIFKENEQLKKIDCSKTEWETHVALFNTIYPMIVPPSTADLKTAGGRRKRSTKKSKKAKKSKKRRKTRKQKR
jgi:hypothetical protein